MSESAAPRSWAGAPPPSLYRKCCPPIAGPGHLVCIENNKVFLVERVTEDLSSVDGMERCLCCNIPYFCLL